MAVCHKSGAKIVIYFELVKGLGDFFNVIFLWDGGWNGTCCGDGAEGRVIECSSGALLQSARRIRYRHPRVRATLCLVPEVTERETALRSRNDGVRGRNTRSARVGHSFTERETALRSRNGGVRGRNARNARVLETPVILVILGMLECSNARNARIMNNLGAELLGSQHFKN